MAQLLAQLSPIIITPIALAWILDVALRALYNIAVPLPLLVALGLLTQAFMFAVSYLGVRLSARVAMISGAAQMAAILAGSVVIVLRSRYLSLEPFTMPSVGPVGFFLAVLTGPYTAYIGYSAIVNFGEEAKAPRETIRKAIVAAVIMMAAFYTFVEYSLVVSAPPSEVQGLRSLFLPAVGTAISLVIIYFSLAGLNVPVLYAVPTMAAYLAAVIALAVRRLRG
ncbi:hypothetical protein [Acidilobus sp.]|uniref:hypothetical protein n=1 Tax=Acidilobus sp. TaxID=1872109 RepID=UPI003CFC900D